MQTQWYGDKRDLVKWGTLIHLCRENALKTVIQVPFLPKDNGCNQQLSVDGKSVQFPVEVWRHFRDLRHVEKLGLSTGLRITVLPLEFNHQGRAGYLAQVCESLGRMNGKPKVVFLDPDTGIEPETAGAKHVKLQELQEFWRCLQPGDWLVLYQHALRQNGWEKYQRDRFQKACGVPRVKTYHCKEIASDVRFFAAYKQQ